jgi:hypothetical protein
MAAMHHGLIHYQEDTVSPVAAMCHGGRAKADRRVGVVRSLALVEGDPQ